MGGPESTAEGVRALLAPSSGNNQAQRSLLLGANPGSPRESLPLGSCAPSGNDTAETGGG